MSIASIRTWPTRSRVTRVGIAAIFVISGSHISARQTESVPRPQNWKAAWITAASPGANAPGVYHFRKTFELKSLPKSFIVHVSGDNRYRLYVNGSEVSNGPARGDIANWHYETVDLARQLRIGSNVLAALVWNYGDQAPAAQISRTTGFLMQGEGEQASLVNTGPDWKVLATRAYTFKQPTRDDTAGFYVAGPNEAVDAKLFPWGWDELGADTARWKAARSLGPAEARGSNRVGSASNWQLVPRKIPLPEQRLMRFTRLRRSSGVAAKDVFLSGRGNLVIPPNSKASLLIDNQVLTTGYPVLIVSGGADASATLTYAEALFDSKGHKGNRDEIEGKTIRGVRDSFQFDGGSGRRFQSLWLRTFRYVQLDVETRTQPLRIDDLHAIFAAYPFRQNASFSSDANWIAPIWDLNWRSFRLSAFETFWDTPYYEQVQYVGDSRIEALLSLYQSGDDRLMRNAIEQFANSRIADGLTLSSYPSSKPQVIPPFSLLWIGMIHDYWMLRDDPQFVRSMLPGTRTTLDWFEEHLDERGLLGPMPWWNFLDWTYPGGVPPGGRTGGSIPLTLQFVLALREAAELEVALGRPEYGDRYRRLANQVAAAVRRTAWDEQRGLLADTPEGTTFGQQANALGLLADAVPAAHRLAVGERLMTDGSLIKASYYFRFYVDEALRRAGLADRYLDRLKPWRDMLTLGLTATPETPEPTRSDSHAWSAHPNYHLLATVAGIRPVEPGFRKVEIAPSPGRLKRLRARMPHPKGYIEVRIQRGRTVPMAAVVTLPDGVPGVFRWRDQALALPSGRTRIQCTFACVIH